PAITLAANHGPATGTVIPDSAFRVSANSSSAVRQASQRPACSPSASRSSARHSSAPFRVLPLAGSSSSASRKRRQFTSSRFKGFPILCLPLFLSIPVLLGPNSPPIFLLLPVFVLSAPQSAAEPETASPSPCSR